MKLLLNAPSPRLLIAGPSRMLLLEGPLLLNFDLNKYGYFYFLILLDSYERKINLSQIFLENAKLELSLIENSHINHLAVLVEQLEFEINSTIFVKEHTFEEKYYITEVGLRFYIWEEKYTSVFSKQENTGRIVFDFDFIEYKGYSRVNFIVLNKEWNFLESVVKPCLSLTIPRELRIVSQIVNFTTDSFDLENQAGIERLLSYTLECRKTLQNLNLRNGYVKSFDIFSAEYPYLNEISKEFVEKWWDVPIHRRAAIYKCVCNLFMLTLFSKICEALNNLEYARTDIYSPDYISAELWLADVKSCFRILKSWSYSMIDNSIKQHLRKTKVHVANDIYAGFDTEYVPLEWGRNLLVSAQLSLASGYKVIIPKLAEYKYEGVNTNTGETYIKQLPFFDEKEVKYNTTVQSKITECRENLYPGFDAAIKNIHNYMSRSDRWFQQAETKNSHLYQIKRSSIKSLLILPQEGEELKIKFDSLIDIIRYRMNSHMLWKEKIHSMLEKAAGTKHSTSSSSSSKSDWAWENSFMVCPIEEFILSNEENSSKKVNSKSKDVYNITEHVTSRARIYLIAHYNAADLGMIEDWAEVSYKNIDILKKSYCSLSSPIKSLNFEVHIRDTILLSSAVASTLDAVGKSYGLKKRVINSKWYSQMDRFLKAHPEEFKAYAMQDSLITLVHALFMNDFVFKLGDFKVPCTLGSIATKYLKNKWRLDGYRGFQADPEFLIGQSNSHTPKGLSSLGIVGDGLNQFIASFRGGRNECFAYGIDTERRWFDYDLTSCYSTIMSMCGDPNYESTKELGKEQEIIIESSESSEKESSLLSSTSSSVQEMQTLSLSSSTPAEKKKSLEEERLWVKVEELEKKTKVPALTEEEYDEILLQQEKIMQEILHIQESSLEEEQDIQEFAALTPTVGSLCGDPDYNNATSIIPGSYKDVLKNYNFHESYSALRVRFNFSPAVIYPPIPMQVKCNNTFQTIYPLNGESTITGLEFLAACDIIKIYGGYIKVLSGTIIPFKKDKVIKKKIMFEGEEIWVEKTIPAYSPFSDVIKDLQGNRKKWKELTGKKSAMERIYKDLGNMLYGKVVAGISNKDKYDSRLLANKKLLAGDLTNPLIGAWITGFVRALLAELLNYTNKLGGKITAVTTDGFVTDIENLESKILEMMKENKVKNSFLHKYIKARITLSGDKNAEALEVKTSVRGIAQWTTRGQISINHTDPALQNFQIPISAMTGFQSRQFSQQENIEMVKNALKSQNEVLFLQHRLSGALENYKEKKDVSMFSSLRKYRTVFDSKRIIVPAENEMLFTYPYISSDQFVLARTLLDQFRQSIYSAQFSKLFAINVTSSNVTEDMIKYIVRLFAAKMNWILSIKDKFYLIKEFNLILRELNINGFKEEILLDIINNVLQNPGTIVNKLVVFRKTQDFVDILFATNSKLINLLNLRSHFSNFILPAPTLEELNSSYFSIKRIIDSSRIELDNIKSRLDVLNFFEPILTVPVKAFANNNQVIVEINGRKFLALD